MPRCYLSKVSLVVAWLLKCNISRLFYDLQKFFYKQCGTHISRVQNRLFISSECPFHTLGPRLGNFQVYIIILLTLSAHAREGYSSHFVVSWDRPFTQSLRWERVWSNSHSGLVSTGPGISWTGNWFRVAVASLYKQCGWKKIAREVFATRQLFSRRQRAENC